MRGVVGESHLQHRQVCIPEPEGVAPPLAVGIFGKQFHRGEGGVRFRDFLEVKSKEFGMAIRLRWFEHLDLQGSR